MGVGSLFAPASFDPHRASKGNAGSWTISEDYCELQRSKNGGSLAAVGSFQRPSGTAPAAAHSLGLREGK